MGQESEDLEIAVLEVDITPEGTVRLAGYQARRGPAAPSRPGELRAAITGLRKAGEAPVWLIGLDTLFVDEAFAADLAACVPGLDPARILAVASHTHGGPNFLTTAMTDAPPDPAYRAMVLDRLGRVLGGDLAWKPVVRIARARSPGPPSVNRRRVGLYLDRPEKRLRRGAHYGHNARGARDPDLHGLAFHTKVGVAAFWWSFAAHPAFDPDRDRITADFPGALRSHIQRAAPGAVVGYLPGFAGSVIPGVQRYLPGGPLLRRTLARLPLIPGLGGFTEEGYVHWCGQLVGAWDALHWEEIEATSALTLTRTRIPNIFRNQDPPLALTLARLDVAGQPVIFLSGEPLAEWRPVLAPHLDPGAILTGYAAGPPAYVAPSACLDDGGYEVDGFQRAFGLMGRVTPEVDARLVSALKSLSGGEP